ncbi:T9SS type A sorting domain-containing protein [Flavobacteriaceae bacterium]|nr:T9SS type A sorting domain-containing protein [Flavobacteriaceae bacterium]
MKKITLLMSLLITTVGFSQTTIDFEAGGLGAAWNWTMDQNGTNPALEFVSNPNTTGNTTATTAKFTAEVAGQTYALTFTDGIGDITFTAENSLIKMWVNKSVASDVAVKLEGVGISKEVKVANTVVNGDWEQLSFNFSNEIGNTYNKLVIIPDFAARTTENIVYFDEITFHPAPAEVVPTTAPTTPVAREAGDVISIFSDAYTDVALGEIDPSWSPGILTTLDFAGNSVWKITNCDFLAVTQYAGIDFSEMDKLHIDYWTPDTAGSLLNIKIVDTASGAEQLISLGNTVSGSWQSVEVDLSVLTINVSNITQILYDPTSESNTHYVDNFYFYKSPTAGLEDISANSVKMYPNPANGVVYFSTTANDALTVSVFDLLGKQVMDAQNVQSQLNISSLNPGMYFVKMTQGASSATKKLVVK